MAALLAVHAVSATTCAGKVLFSFFYTIIRVKYYVKNCHYIPTVKNVAVVYFCVKGGETDRAGKYVERTLLSV